MSDFSAKFVNKNTGEEKDVICQDDYFGRHQYGYIFDKTKVLNEEEMLEQGWQRKRE